MAAMKRLSLPYSPCPSLPQNLLLSPNLLSNKSLSLLVVLSVAYFSQHCCSLGEAQTPLQSRTGIGEASGIGKLNRIAVEYTGQYRDR